MDFSDALQALKNGDRVRRMDWSNGVFVFLVSGSKFKVNRPPLLGIYPEGTEISYASHIDIRDKHGRVGPWTPSQCDMMADDWEYVS